MLMSTTFVLTSVSSFYLDQFQDQMDSEFSGQLGVSLNACLKEEAPLDKIREVMDAFGSSRLGIDYTNRNYYILDAATGKPVDSSESSEDFGGITDNIISAMNGNVGNMVLIRASLMDYAYPLKDTDATPYIIYIANEVDH